MYSVFSQFIVNEWKRTFRSLKDVPTEITLFNMIDDMYKLYDLKNKPDCIHVFGGILWCNVITTLDDIAEEASKELWINSELRKILRWIELNIVAEMSKIKTRTTLNVKIRIAVDMLNKLKDEGKITKDLNLFYFHNVVTNSLDLWYDTLDLWGELPF